MNYGIAGLIMIIAGGGFLVGSEQRPECGNPAPAYVFAQFSEAEEAASVVSDCVGIARVDGGWTLEQCEQSGI